MANTITNQKRIKGELSAKIDKALKAYDRFDKRAKQIKTLIDNGKNTVKELMELYVGRVETDMHTFVMSLIPETLVFDTDRFKADYPEIYAKYCTKKQASQYKISQIKLKVDTIKLK